MSILLASLILLSRYLSSDGAGSFFKERLLTNVELVSVMELHKCRLFSVAYVMGRKYWLDVKLSRLQFIKFIAVLVDYGDDILQEFLK